MSEQVKEARRMMRVAFANDPDFLYGYIANIAMILHDNFNKANFLDQPTREEAARQILKRIFWD